MTAKFVMPQREITDPGDDGAPKWDPERWAGWDQQAAGIDGASLVVSPEERAQREAAIIANTHAERFVSELARELVTQRARREAKRRLDAEDRDDQGTDIPDPTTLADLLEEEDEETRWRIQGVWPAGGHILLSAGAKSGKTTTTGNVVRSLVDGDRLFKVYPVEAVTDGTVAVLDFEMPRKSVRAWLRDQRIRNGKQVVVWTQRGRAHHFDLRDREARGRWVAKLRAAGVKVWVIDCLSPVLSALGIGENDNTEVGRFLDGITTAAAEGGVDEVLLIHHMGHSAERSRGASRLVGWPDVNWRIVRQRDENNPTAEPEPDSPRFFSAYGRDVDVREGRLLYDEVSRHLTFVEGGRKASEATDALGRVLVWVRDNPKMTVEAIEKAMNAAGLSRKPTRKALADAKTKGYVVDSPGQGRSRLHEITGPGRSALRMLSGNPLSDDDMDAAGEEAYCACGGYIAPDLASAGVDVCRPCQIEAGAA